MDEYISREALLQTIRNMINYRPRGGVFGLGRMCLAIVDAIKNAPTADVEEVVHGEWVTDEEDLAWGNSLKRKHCSECSGRPHWDNDEREFILAKFCHHCGAKMDGKRKEGEEA